MGPGCFSGKGVLLQRERSPSLQLQLLTEGYFPPSLSNFAFGSISGLMLQESLSPARVRG